MQLRDRYTPESVGALAAAVQAEHPSFDRGAFLARVFAAGWEEMALKKRMRRVTTCLHVGLPEDYRRALAILHRVVPRVTEWTSQMSFPDYVEVYGLEDYDASIAALETFTQFFSAEFAIRPFIVRYPHRTMAQMLAWTRHDSSDVRRLASEGCRPRLPWGMALKDLQRDPSPIVPILDGLKLDESESVRKSVANNLNDISKDNPDQVLAVLRRWQAVDCDETRWITSHALRTLIKAGHPEALALLGYPPEPQVAVCHLAVEPSRVAVGGTVTISFDIESLSGEPQKLMIDYVVYSVKANGKRTPKVWKLSKRFLQPGEVLCVQRVHSLAPVSTRRYYPGEHLVSPQINGQRFGQASFELIVDSE